MQGIWVLAAAVVFFGIGLGVGLLLLQKVREAAALRAQQSLGVELASLREQVRSRDGQLSEAFRQAEALNERSAAAEAEVKMAAERAAELGARLAKAGADLDAARSQTANAAAESSRLRAAVEKLQASEKELAEARTRLEAELDAERRGVAERAAESERNREQVRAEIEKLAGRVLDEKGKAMLERSQLDLRSVLEPLREKLKQFEEKVEKTYDQDNRDRVSLLQRLKDLQAAQDHLHQDAESLTRALTGESKAQGDWGELILETILETAGLTEGREYDLQVSHLDEEGGRKRPDAVVNLPQNRAIVVDAKCSLTAFVDSTRATRPEEREAALDGHLASVRAHVKSLAAKNYQDVLQQRTLDAVLMFVPNEAAFHAAIARDPTIHDEAFRQGVVICSPTTLLAALKIISHVWRSEKQNANAQHIAKEAGNMLEKLAAFVEDLDDVGKRIDQARVSFDLARGKLATGKGNVLKRAARIVELGAHVKEGKAQNLLPSAGDDDEGEESVGVGAPRLPDSVSATLGADPTTEP